MKIVINDSPSCCLSLNLKCMYDILSLSRKVRKTSKSSPCDIGGLVRMFWSIKNTFWSKNSL